jgi:deoxycytidylate deaminase
MYSAKSAAGNSACLSRQVGATITDSNGVPLAHGWNDVPRFGGNLYRDTDTDSQNCYIRGKCTNVTHKNEIIEEILTEIKKKLPDKQENKLRISITDRIQSPDLISTIEKIIKQSKFKSIIEYSRSIHAEMHAIIIGSQMTGNKMINGNLYCTTYPCHNCARHIVLAGIKNIYYIEPYKKSLCLTLHDDSLTEDESVEDKVRILVYEGVAPRRVLEFFSMIEDNRKKENGHVKNIDRSTAVPKKRLSLQSLPMLENQAIHALNEYGLLTETIDL